MLAISRLHHWIHPNPVIILILTLSLYTKNSLHTPILKFKINTIGLMTDSPVGIHQRELVSQVKVKLNPTKFSKIYVLHVKMTDGTVESISQSEVM